MKFSVLFTLKKLGSRFTSTMSGNILDPPSLVGLKVLDKQAFNKIIKAPKINFKLELLQKVKPMLKPVMLKMPKLKPLVLEPEPAIIINPTMVKNWEDMDLVLKEKLLMLGIAKSNFDYTEIVLSYENWNADDILKAILPKGVEITRSFSKVGHIIHLNLRDHLLEFKEIIGQVLLDKTPNTRTVVNKTTKIDNTYRNFSMELICGENQMVTQVKENGIAFEFDFSKVYWNPRLSTEHMRITNMLTRDDVLFDVFCGVGPFALPAAKKKVRVFANDLNPESYTWLNKSSKLNKIDINYLTTYNKDGKDFIQTDVKEKLMELASDTSFIGKVHVTMNLPALALDFVRYFRYLFERTEIASVDISRVLPNIHVYFFVHGTTPEEQAKTDFFEHTDLNFNEIGACYQYVRNVSPKKDMVKIMFVPPLNFLIKPESDEFDEPVTKKFCGDL